MEWMDYLLELAPLVNKNMYPLTWRHAVGIVIFAVIGYYVMNPLFRIPIVRWTYMGVLVIFIANLFHRGKKGKATVDIFKLALV
jgi:hypothetical protein